MNTSKTTMTASASAETPMSSVALRTRNGKIARLPLEIREQLNHRLDDGEQGKPLVAWLNSLPEVQAVVKAAFGGRAVSEQNLSEWRQGGYRDWQRQQERRELVRQWSEDAKDLEGTAGGVPFNSALSTILLAELAQAVRDVLEETTDAGIRMERLQEVARRFAQLRREESNAERVQIAKERWGQEQAKAERLKRAAGSLMPLQALFLQQCYLEMFNRAGAASRGAAVGLGEAMLDPERPCPAGENPTQSD
jgi:hypothetical protein